MRLLKKGDRIRLKVRTFGGWKGTATVTTDQVSADDVVWFRKDGSDPDSYLAGRCCACRHEVALVRAGGGRCKENLSAPRTERQVKFSCAGVLGDGVLKMEEALL